MPYSSMEDVNPSVKGIKPPVTLAQANAIARIADKLESAEGVESPWAVAINQFKESHTVKDDAWVRKEGSRMGELSGRIGKAISRMKATLAGQNDTPLNKGIKAIEIDGDRYLVLWTSNAFEDREREIFSTKAWEDYVGRVDASGNYGRVWFWHVKGSDFADIEWVDMVGRILVEVAKVDNTPRGTKMFYALQHPEEYPALLPIGWGTSHGYVYKEGDKEAGIYARVHKFETTVLPLHVAANLYGGIKGVIDMTVTDEKVKGLAALLGEEEAEKVLKDAGVESDAMVKAGVSFKEDKFPPKKVEEEEEEEEEEEGAPPKEGEEEEGMPPKKKFPPKEGEEEEEEKSQGQFFELEMDDDLLKEIASHVDVDVSGHVEAAIKELTDDLLKVVKDAAEKAAAAANVASKEQIVQQALSGKLRLKPYVASKSADTIVPPEEVREADKAGAQNPVADVVKRMLSGV